MNLYVLKNSEGLYWSKENTYTPYVNFAKVYDYYNIEKAAKRKNCTIHEVTIKYINNKYEFYLTEK